MDSNSTNYLIEKLKNITNICQKAYISFFNRKKIIQKQNSLGTNSITIKLGTAVENKPQNGHIIKQSKL